MGVFDEMNKFIFFPDVKNFLEGYINSAMLSGAYSGYNPVIMHFAGVMGGFNNCFKDKETFAKK